MLTVSRRIRNWKPPKSARERRSSSNYNEKRWLEAGEELPLARHRILRILHHLVLSVPTRTTATRPRRTNLSSTSLTF